MKTDRNFNAEFSDSCGRKYAYDFDYDVMHPFMIRTFEPFFRPGRMLELGGFKGRFTKRLLPFFDDITCVEASSAAMDEARAHLPGHVKFVNDTFENAELPSTYENIVLTHVLEHVEDPVRVLQKIETTWLSGNGRLFLACPNGNAPSRQIAVKMGLISHNTAVTPPEAAHGHHRTYILDTLERDAVSAGLRVVYRTGVFFKALANFQWDKSIHTDVVSQEYLEGCFKLGQQYPDLCASIVLICERGNSGANNHG